MSSGHKQTWRKAQFLRNRVESLIKSYKKEKIQSELNRNKDYPKIFWENIREIWPNNNTTSIHSLSGESSNTVIEQGIELAEHVNEFFANVGRKLADDIRNNIRGAPPLLHTVLNDNQDNILRDPVTADKLLCILNNIDISKSSAIENVSGQWS